MENEKRIPIIDDALVSRVARLARLAPDATERAALQEELGQILGHFSRLELLDTKGVLPAYHPHDLENQLRDDIEKPSFSPEDLTGLSGFSKDGCLLAPRTVE